MGQPQRPKRPLSRRSDTPFRTFNQGFAVDPEFDDPSDFLDDLKYEFKNTGRVKMDDGE